MTYVPGIENDVFISFARGETVPDIDRQWVSRFVSDLELELGRLPGGAELKIFFDETVPRNNYFGVVIPNLQRSALFVAIISPEVASERQLIEFEAFADMPNAKGRIIFIETFPPEHSYPSARQGFLSVKFWALHSGAKRRLEPGEWTGRLRHLANVTSEIP